MADHTQDEYKPVKFYAENTAPKKAGFSKFKYGGSYYFCRYVDNKITLISQAYTGQPGRDNGIESVKKNEKLAKRYRFDARGQSGHGFSLKAGNGQEIAISPSFASASEAQKMASRLSGAKFSSGAAVTAGTTKPKKGSSKKAATKRAAPKKAPAKAASFTSKDSRIENYRPLSFYEANGAMANGFNSFEKDGAYYFHYVEGGKIVLISESYTSKAGRDNGVASVTKNMRLTSAYEHHAHKNGKHYFDINAANKQEIATSRWYSSGASAESAAAKLRGETAAPRKANEEDNYPPLAFYRKHTKGKKKGFETFKGDDGEYYFAYFDNSKLTLISEGYPTAAVRDTGLASVEKNMKIEKRYVQGTGADGKPGFTLRAGNHKEIARSVGYGSAAAAATGAAYLLGTRRRSTTAKAKGAPKKVAAAKTTAQPKTVKPVAKKPAAKKKPAVNAAAPLAAAGVVAAGAGAKKAQPKVTSVKKVSVPVKAAAIVAAPVAAATVGAAALANSNAESKAGAVAAAPIEAAAPVAAAAAAPAAASAAPAAGSGIWGWLKWLLLGLLGLLALLFLFKTCAGGSADVVTTPPVVAESAAPAAAMVTCWNGSEVKDDAACPAKISCWDDSFATSEASCPAKPVAKDYLCWDGTKAVDQAACPAKPAAKPAQQTSAKMTAPSIAGRICGSSPNVLFDVGYSTPISVGRLGTNPQFGDSTGYSPDEFFRRLQVKYNTSPRDKSFLDLLATSLGYGSFQNMDVSMFSEDRLAQGTSGLLGFGTQHALQYSTLNVADPTHLEAFKVRSANGTDVHFMKRCGNFMYVCQPQR